MKFQDLLSPSLKLETMQYINRTIFTHELSPFKDAPVSDKQLIVSHLRLHLYQADEYVLNQGEIGSNVYFIVNGQADVILERSVSLSSIRKVSD